MKNLFLIILLFSAQVVFAQSELPSISELTEYSNISNPVENMIYSKTIHLKQEEIKMDSIALWYDNKKLVEDLNLKKNKDYWVRKGYVLKEAYIDFTILPPKIDTTEEVKKIIFNRELKQLNNYQPNFDSTKIYNLTEEVVVFEERLEWLAFQEPLTNTDLSAEKTNCIVWKYHKTQQRIVKKRLKQFYKNGSWWLETLPDSFIVTRPYLSTKENYKFHYKGVPAVYDTSTIIYVLDESIRNQLRLIPRKFYRLIYIMEDWREVLTTEIPNFIILEIQVALRARGYNVDLTNQLDSKTNQALIDYGKSISYQVGLQEPSYIIQSLGLKH